MASSVDPGRVQVTERPGLKSCCTWDPIFVWQIGMTVMIGDRAQSACWPDTWHMSSEKGGHSVVPRDLKETHFLAGTVGQGSRCGGPIYRWVK